MATSSSTSTTETESDNEGEFETPPKLRRKSKVHGFSRKRALYYKAKRSNLPTLLSESPSLVHYPTAGLLPANYPINTDATTTIPDDDSPDSSSSLFDSSTTDSVSSSTSEDDTDDSFRENNSNDEDSFSETDHQGNSDKHYNRYLYEGSCHTKLSLYTAVVMCVNKHSLTREAFSDILAIVASIDRSWELTTSVYKVKEIMRKCTKLADPEIHFFCENCQARLQSSTEKCSSCTTDTVLEYSSLNLEKQMEELFTDETFCKLVMAEAVNAEQGVWKDVIDGEEYKRLVKMRQSADRHILQLTFTLNTDGVAVFSSSKKGNLWPVYLAINELPIQLRFTKKYIIPCCLYCQVEKPNMLTYLSNIMKILTVLSSEGMVVDTCFGRRTLKCHLLAACLDLPAKALVANMKQFNGKFGCIACFDEGQSNPRNPMHRFYPFVERNQQRSHLSIIQDMHTATRNGHAERGMKGASPLTALRYIDLAKVFPIDWMHCVLLGITKALLNFWFGISFRAEKFFIGDKMALLNRRLLQIQVPDFVARRQRCLEEAKHWKASECREWLLHFSIPVLRGNLDSEALVHYSLLVSGIGLLTKEVVTTEDILLAEELLLDFCRVFPNIYGVEKQTMNLHLLRHLPGCVRSYGPLFHFSCFGFESMNSHLKSMIHGTSNVNSQITFAVAMTKSLPNLVKGITEMCDSDIVRKLLAQLSCKPSRDDFCGNDRTICGAALGKLTMYPAPNHLIQEALMDNNLDGDILKFQRYRCGSNIIKSKEYNRSKTRRNSTVLFEQAGTMCVGEVAFFLQCAEMDLAMIRKYKFVGPVIEFPDSMNNMILLKYKQRGNQLCGHIQQVVEDVDCVVPATKIVKICLFMKMDDFEVVSIPPNLLEHS